MRLPSFNAIPGQGNVQTDAQLSSILLFLLLSNMIEKLVFISEVALIHMKVTCVVLRGWVSEGKQAAAGAVCRFK